MVLLSNVEYVMSCNFSDWMADDGWVLWICAISHVQYKNNGCRRIQDHLRPLLDGICGLPNTFATGLTTIDGQLPQKT